MLNLAAVSGIAAITASGMWPFSLSNLNEVVETDAGTVTTAGMATTGVTGGNNLFHMLSSTIPLDNSPLFVWNVLTAISVLGPNVPIASTPNLICNFLTSSLTSPFFNNIIIFLYGCCI